MKSKMIKYMKTIDPDSLIIQNIPSLNGEIWVRINRSIYPDLKPYYWISNYGRIYSEVSNMIMKSRHLDPEKVSSPYYKIALQTNDGKHSISKSYLIHRLMMCSFFPVENMENLVVNHIDGNKLNDNLSNLEWTTEHGNMQHAISHGLLNPIYGEKHTCAKISESDAKEIILLLLDRKLTHKEIANRMHCSLSIVDSIAEKKAWKYLSKDIDFSSLSQRIPKTLSFSDIERICLWIKQNPKDPTISLRKYCIEALRSIGMNNPTEGTLNSIRYLYEKKRYTDISKKYNF